MIGIMAWFQKSAKEREREQRKAEIAQDTLDRINRAIYVKRPRPTDIRSILEVHRIRIRMVDEPKGIPTNEPYQKPVLTNRAELVGKTHTATLAGLQP